MTKSKNPTASLPDGWTASHWANELERRAAVADESQTKMGDTMRRWAAEVRESDSERNGESND